MEFLAFLIIVVAFILLVEKITNKILGVEKKKISETSGKKIDFWGRIIIGLIFLSSLWFVITNGSVILMKVYFMTYLAVLIGFQAAMEFFFIKESKQYISTIILLIIGLVIIYNIDNFSFLE